jgi:hypothetical protein
MVDMSRMMPRQRRIVTAASEARYLLEAGAVALGRRILTHKSGDHYAIHSALADRRADPHHHPDRPLCALILRRGTAASNRRADPKK